MARSRQPLFLRGPCAGRRGCTRRDHQARGLCNACYKHYYAQGSIERFPLTRRTTSTRQRYDEWVASGMRVGEYAALVGIPVPSLSRALRIERERLKRRNLPYVDGYRRVQVM